MNALDLLRSDPNVADSFKDAIRIVDECTADLKRDNDIAKRKAELQTTLTRKLDLGVMGEVTAEIEYDAAPSEPLTWDYPGYPGYFHVTSMKVNGTDIWPAFDKETQTIFENELSEALKYEAREEA